MFESIRTFLFGRGGSDTPTPDSSPSPERLRLAACALLLEVAYADDHFTDRERSHLAGMVRRHFGLDVERANELIEMAERERNRAVDLWTFANLVNDHYSEGQKLLLAEAMWGLVLSDGELASQEDYLIRKISNLLRLKAGYLAEARKRVEQEGDGEGDGTRPD